jgi:hypothetical protein
VGVDYQTRGDGLNEDVSMFSSVDGRIPALARGEAGLQDHRHAQQHRVHVDLL